MIYIQGGRKQDEAGFHQCTQNGTEFKSYELLISRTFHIIFWDNDCR
jgi:hypothetical protein